MARGNLLPFGFGSQRGDPFQLLRREMEQLFDSVGGTGGEASGAGGNIVAPLTHATRELNARQLAYLHVVNPAMAALDSKTPPSAAAMQMLQRIREAWQGPLMLAGGFDAETAEQWLRDGRADLIAIGRKFIANPDLPERLRAHAPLNADDRTTYYGGGEKGYTDYTSLAQERGQAPKACVDESWR